MESSLFWWKTPQIMAFDCLYYRERQLWLLCHHKELLHGVLNFRKNSNPFAAFPPKHTPNICNSVLSFCLHEFRTYTSTKNDDDNVCYTTTGWNEKRACFNAHQDLHQLSLGSSIFRIACFCFLHRIGLIFGFVWYQLNYFQLILLKHEIGKMYAEFGVDAHILWQNLGFAGTH